MICRASGGHGEKVRGSAALPDALRRGLRIVKEEKRQVVLNVIWQEAVKILASGPSGPATELDRSARQGTRW